MAQDFAKQRSNPDGNKRKRAASKPPPHGNANWSWFFSGLMSGVIVSIAAYLGVLKLGEGVVESAQSEQTTAEDLPAFFFDFYSELAKAEVAVNVPPGSTETGTEAAPASPAPDSPDPADATPDASAATQELASANEQRPALYLLQVGSYQNREDAESLRARMILLNMNAIVREGVVAGRTYYRVQVGPFAGRKSRDEARDILSANGLDSMSLLVQ